MKHLALLLSFFAPLIYAEDPVSGGSEISVILAKERFYPTQIRLRSGAPTTLVFSTVNKKPAALVIEQAIQGRSVAMESPSEITREINSENVTVISLSPAKGKFNFHDALGSARGEIIVE